MHILQSITIQYISLTDGMIIYQPVYANVINFVFLNIVEYVSIKTVICSIRYFYPIWGKNIPSVICLFLFFSKYLKNPCHF